MSLHSPQLRRLRIFLIAALPITVVGGLVLLYFHNPSEVTLGFCLVRRATGLDCPGCGMTHALYSLLHLRFAAAFFYNPFVYPLTLFLSILTTVFYIYLLTGKPHIRLRLPKSAAVVLVAVLALFMVLRNIPVRPFSYFKI